MASLLGRLPSSSPGRASALGWLLILGSVAAGIAGWATGTLVGGVVALWAFCLAAACAALILPLPYALVSALFAGVLGWLVDMLPLVILVGWTTVVLRWGFGLLRERRLPRGGRWTWIPIALVVWTGLGIFVITGADFKHFLLLLGIQVIASGLVLATAEGLRTDADRLDLASGLVAFIVLLSVAVFMQWLGVNIEALQNGETRKRVETAYGLDAFPNNIGMIKYARSIKAGSRELRVAVDEVAADNPEMPSFDVFRPKFQAYENHLVVRFAGSARGFEDELSRARVTLLYDNVGLAPANTVPRMRSFPRNALTYAGICAAILPLAFFVAWSRRRWLGWAGVVACLFGVAFSLARGAWIAVGIGALYLLVDATFSKQRRLQIWAAIIATAIVLTGVFLIKYDVDPVTGRAGGGASVNTRGDLYKDTLSIFKGPKRYVLLGYGTEQPRTESGTVKEGTRYVPRAGTHSTYLNYLFRTGLPGALLIVALYGVAILHARAEARDSRGERSVFASLLTASMLLAAAHAVILSLYVEPIYTLVISVLMGAALAGAGELKRSIVPWRTVPR